MRPLFVLSAENKGKRVTDVDANVHESVIVNNVRFGFLAVLARLGKISNMSSQKDSILLPQPRRKECSRAYTNS
jgi:hypothetical protein